MKIYVISGGPGTGKTTILEALKEKGFTIIPETARELTKQDPRFKNKSIKEINQTIFQDAIFNYQEAQLQQIKKQNPKIVFLDRSNIDNLAYYKIHNLKIPENYVEIAKKTKYNKIFILDPLENYEQDSLRQESKQEQENIHNTIIRTYKSLNYNPVFIPRVSINERLNLILAHIQKP